MAQPVNPATLMLLCNKQGVPTFDSARTCKLSRYFDNLKQIFAKVGFATEQHDREMKQYAVWYVDYDTEQLWKSFTEYDDNATYPAFKKVVLLNYPDASGDFIYSIRDMDVLAGEKQHVGINTLTEMADYHMQFLAITKWLIKKKLLSDLEQQRAYTCAFQVIGYRHPNIVLFDQLPCGPFLPPFCLLFCWYILNSHVRVRTHSGITCSQACKSQIVVFLC
jgi:hypothetical protein